MPGASAGSFILGDTGHVDNHFAFVPRVNYNYQFTDLGFGISASGTFLSLSGRLQRELGSSNTGLAQLTANSQLTIVVANLVEFTKHFGPDDLRKKGLPRWGLCDELSIDLSIGSRYTSITQNYTGSLSSSTGGPNFSTRYSTQSFQGLGLTASVDLYCPLDEDQNVLLFSTTRPSILVGDNRKDSTLTVTIAGVPGNTAHIQESKTAYIPVVEQQLGVEWRVLMLGRTGVEPGSTWVTLRTALVAQYWGGVGPLSAGSTQEFRTSDLFLVGASVLVGINR